MAKKDKPAEPNQLPLVVIETPATVGYVDSPFQINLTLSEDPDGEIVKTIIQWGDQSANTEMGRPEWASHRYRAAGTYPITVACSDDKQQIAFGAVTINIIVAQPFEVDDLLYQADSPNGQPVYVALDQPVTVNGGTAPYAPPVYEPDDIPAGNLFGVGESLVKFYVEDALGQRAWGEATVVVTDTSTPTEDLVVIPPADEYITTAGQSAVVEWDAASATGGAPPYTFRYMANGLVVQSGDTFPIGVTEVSAIATDSAGDEAAAPFTIVVEYLAPIPPGNNDEYFQSRAAHASCIYAYALTSDAEIAKYRRGAYDPYQPYYDPQMHAMRISIEAGSGGSLKNQVWLPVKKSDPGQTVIIWEEIDGPNWNDKGGFTGWKYYQVRRNGDKIWFEVGGGGCPEPYAIGKSRVRQYSVVGPNTILGNYEVNDEYGTTQYNNDSVRSAINFPSNYKSTRGKPTRHMIVINQDPNDPTYCVFQYWATDPDHPPKAIHDGIEITCPDSAGVAGQGRPQHFDFEINSSQSRPVPGPEACMWARYVTVHRGVSDPASLFQQITGW